MAALARYFFFATASPATGFHDDPVAPILIALALASFAAAREILNWPVNPCSGTRASVKRDAAVAESRDGETYILSGWIKR